MNNSLESLLQSRGITFRSGGEHHHVRVGWIGVDCPFCGTGSGKFHLGINRSGKFASCWKCGPHSIVSTIQALLHITFREAKQITASLGWSLTETHSQGMQQLQIPTGIGDLTKPHLDYLEGRGFNVPSLIDLWGLKGLGVAGRLSWRIWIPILYEGRLVSWTTRAIGEDVEDRYINARPSEQAISPKRFLYGQHYALSTILVVEGPTDVWKIGPGAVATMGLQYTQSQLRWMTRYPVRFVCFDNHPDANARARRLVDQLSLFPGTTYQLSIDADDPGSANRREVKLIRKTVFGD